jgi:hypothetical protein
MKKFTKKFLSMILVSALVMTMGIGAFATEEPVEPTEEPAASAGNLIKTFEIAEGVTTPEIVFKFKIEATDSLTGYSDYTFSTGSTGYVTEESITAEVARQGASVPLSQLFASAEFPNAGIYAYKLTELDTDYSTGEGESFTDNTEQAEYTVVAKVVNGDEGPVISELLVFDKDGHKVNNAEFNNKFEKENVEGKPLSISKAVTGAMGDKTATFTFDLTITAPDGGTTGDLTAKIGEEEVTVNYGSNTINLKDGETIKISGILYGSTYSVTEAATDSTIENYSSYETTVEVNGESKDGKETGDTLLSDTSENTVAYTNSLDEIPITGVIINTLPDILIVAIAAAGFFYMQMKKRV